MPSSDYLSPASSPAYRNSILITRAPATRTVPLPPCPDHDHVQPSPPHYGLTSTPRVHPALSAASTVIHYDFRRDPQTIYMSSSWHDIFFPGHEPASSPSASVLHVYCEATGRTIRVRSTRNGVITCLDLIVQLHRFFEGEMGREEWRGVRGTRRSAMKEAYERRTGLAYSASARMKMVDCLLGRTRFKGIDAPEYGDSWLIQTR